MRSNRFELLDPAHFSGDRLGSTKLVLIIYNLNFSLLTFRYLSTLKLFASILVILSVYSWQPMVADILNLSIILMTPSLEHIILRTLSL